MKKILLGLMVVMAIFSMSCKSAPTLAGVSIEGEVTQERVDRALGQIYDAYRSRLDMTGAQEYIVQRGDTLSEITRTFYGNVENVGIAGLRNGFYFPLLMLASRHATIVDPDQIEPGMRLVVPDLAKNIANAGSRQAIKEFLTDVAYVYNRKNDPITESGLLALARSL